MANPFTVRVIHGPNGGYPYGTSSPLVVVTPPSERRTSDGTTGPDEYVSVCGHYAAHGEIINSGPVSQVRVRTGIAGKLVTDALVSASTTWTKLRVATGL